MDILQLGSEDGMWCWERSSRSAIVDTLGLAWPIKCNEFTPVLNSVMQSHFSLYVTTFSLSSIPYFLSSTIKRSLIFRVSSARIRFSEIVPSRTCLTAIPARNTDQLRYARVTVGTTAVAEARRSCLCTSVLILDLELFEVDCDEYLVGAKRLCSLP